MKTFFLLAFFASTVTVILSIPQVRPAFNQAEPQPDVVKEPNDVPANPNILDADNIPNINPRTFGDLFNLSAYLAGAPNDSAALNFIPLITILSALG